MYTSFDDGTWHTMAEGKTTVCGLYTRRDSITDELPKGAELHCGEAPAPKKAKKAE